MVKLMIEIENGEEVCSLFFNGVYIEYFIIKNGKVKQRLSRVAVAFLVANGILNDYRHYQDIYDALTLYIYNNYKDK